MNRKLGFPLPVQEDWPPYDVEHIWVEDVGGNYKVKSFPFFIKGISYDDIIDVKTNDDGYVLDWHHVCKSGNSTIWIIERKETKVAEDLISIGAGIEEYPEHHLMSVNIPPSIDLKILDEVLRRYEDAETVEVAVPVDRIGLLTAR
jgi:hypothetical protein